MTAHATAAPPTGYYSCCPGTGCAECPPTPCGCGNHDIATVAHDFDGREWAPDCCPRCHLVELLRFLDDVTDWKGPGRLAELVDDGALDDDQIAHVLGLATQPAGRQRRLRQLLQRRREPR